MFSIECLHLSNTDSKVIFLFFFQPHVHGVLWPSIASVTYSSKHVWDRVKTLQRDRCRINLRQLSSLWKRYWLNILPLILTVITTTVTDDIKTSNDNNHYFNDNDAYLRSPGTTVTQAVRFHACALVPQRRFVTERTGNLTERGKGSPIYNPGSSCSKGG